MNTAEIISKVTITFSLIYSNKVFDFVGWVIKTPCLFYFRSVKFHYVKKTHDINSLLTLVKIVLASQHKRQPNKSLPSKFVDNWKHRLRLETAHAALCKWATRTHQTCLSKTFANSPNKQKLSKQVSVIIKHCLGNSQINSIPAWSKEFSYITFLYRTNAKVYAYNQSEQILFIHSAKLKKFSTLKAHLSIN